MSSGNAVGGINSFQTFFWVYMEQVATASRGTFRMWDLHWRMLVDLMMYLIQVSGYETNPRILGEGEHYCSGP